MGNRSQRHEEWDGLNAEAARTHAVLKEAMRGGVDGGNAASILSLQRAADAAEAALLRLEGTARRRDARASFGS
jgi:hypothetical protein